MPFAGLGPDKLKKINLYYIKNIFKILIINIV